jgi:hypothetical protein
MNVGLLSAFVKKARVPTEASGETPHAPSS